MEFQTTILSIIIITITMALLLFYINKKLREYNINKLKVVYSREKPLKPLYSLDSSDVVKKNIPASLVFVPAAMGLIIAGEVIKDLTGIKNDKPGA